MHLISRKEEFLKLMDIIDNLKQTINLMKTDYRYDCEQDNEYLRLIRYIEREIQKNEESIRELKEPFLLFIVGGGNYGKSTVINTLLRDKLVETTDLPNTWKVDLFIKSPKEKMEISYNNNTKIIKSLTEGARLLRVEEEKYKTSRKKVASILKEYKNKNDVTIDDLKIYKKNLEERHLYRSSIVQIKYYINKGNILEDFIIVDTPGLNQCLLKNTFNRIKKYYEKADGVIWLIDAQNIVSKVNNEMIEEIEEIGKLHNGKKNIIGVINKMDIVSNGNIADVAKVRRQAREIYESKFDDIVFISAKEAIEGIINKDEDLIERSNIKYLYEGIERYFKSVAKEKQIESKYKNLYIMKENILKEVYNYKRNLYKDLSTYNESQFEQKTKINDFKTYVSTKLLELKKRNIKKKEDLKILRDDVEELENICNKNIENIYSHLYKKSNFHASTIKKNVNIKVYFTKSKNLLLDYNMDIKRNYNSNKLVNKIEFIINKSHPKYEFKEEILSESIIAQKINNLIKEINETINEKLNLIENELNGVRKESFRIKYIEYSIVKKHISYLDDIENIVKRLR